MGKTNSSRRRGPAPVVDVGAKVETRREAMARGAVVMQPGTLR